MEKRTPLGQTQRKECLGNETQAGLPPMLTPQSCSKQFIVLFKEAFPESSHHVGPPV